MRSYKSKKIESALKKKGFAKIESHHHMWALIIRGKRSHIRTRVSHGGMEYSGGVLSHMRRQLGGLTGEEFDKLVQCPLSRDGYLRLLADKGEIDSSDAPSALPSD